MVDQMTERPANVLVDCTMRCVINDVEKPQDGGRVVLSASFDKRTAEDTGVLQVEFVALYTRDEPMRVFPSRRCDMEKDRFRVLIVEQNEPIGDLDGLIYDLAAWCPENDVEAPYDGGRVKIQIMPESSIHKTMRIADAFVVINFLEDEPMRVYPYVRADREARRYRIIVLRHL